MAINKKYSYNGYDPALPEIIAKKIELNTLFQQRVLNRKEYSEACSKLKRGWKRKDLTKEPATDFNNSEIIGSTFAQDEHYTDVFPEGVENCILTKCNLGNCNIPTGFTVNGGTNKHYAKQNDGEYWVVDKQLKPVEPLIPQRYDEYGLSKNPKGLPSSPMGESIISQAEKVKAKQDRKSKIIAIVNDPEKLNNLIDKNGVL